VLGAIRATFMLSRSGTSPATCASTAALGSDASRSRVPIGARLNASTVTGSARSNDLDCGHDGAVADRDGCESEDPVWPVREVADDKRPLGPGDQRTLGQPGSSDWRRWPMVDVYTVGQG
jgi:hypothetical protein